MVEAKSLSADLCHVAKSLRRLELILKIVMSVSESLTYLDLQRWRALQNLYGRNILSPVAFVGAVGVAALGLFVCDVFTDD